MLVRGAGDLKRTQVSCDVHARSPKPGIVDSMALEAGMDGELLNGAGLGVEPTRQEHALVGGR